MSIIEVNNVTKEYRLGAHTRFKTTASNPVKRLNRRLLKAHRPCKIPGDIKSSRETSRCALH